MNETISLSTDDVTCLEPKGDVEEGAEGVDEVEAKELELQRRFVLFRGAVALVVVEEDHQVVVDGLFGVC